MYVCMAGCLETREKEERVDRWKKERGQGMEENEDRGWIEAMTTDGWELGQGGWMVVRAGVDRWER